MAWVTKRQRKDDKDSYKVSWRVGGKMRSKTFRRSSDAHRFKREIEHQLDEGTYRDPNLGKIRLGEFFEHFMRTRPPKAPSTRALYEMHARLYLIPNLGEVPLNVLSLPRISGFMADLREAGVGAPTISAVHRLLRRVLNVAVKERRLRENPASWVELPPTDRREMLFLTARDASALANAVPERYRTLIYFLAYSGARIGEAAALRIKQVDLTKGTVRIEEASKEVNGKVILGPTKTGQKRQLHLPRSVVEMLAEHIATYCDSTDPEGEALDIAALDGALTGSMSLTQMKGLGVHRFLDRIRDAWSKPPKERVELLNDWTGHNGKKLVRYSRGFFLD